ncbi:hypothetical protein B0H21DRAFT_312985 [Amylocystis lapponica]|nr:hypothetical protein B0H21DRAFT_312985 [Amylocystis lapponica]
MPRRESNESDETINRRSKKPRAKSASEIARYTSTFETWSTYHGCEEVAFQDIPRDMRLDVRSVFNVNGLLPKEWLDERSAVGIALNDLMPAGFMQFLKTAGKASPDLFSSKVPASDCKELLSDLQSVFLAWTRLKKMKHSSRKWSEADYVANVYTAIRSTAVQQCDYRAQCSVSLSQPLSCHKVSSNAVCILNSKTACPDVAIFIPSRLVLDLSHRARSLYKVLKAHRAVAHSGSVGGESSFRFQSTPCTKLPDTPGFEFVSVICEDKKPMHDMDGAYRQNRLATTSSVRQLHALHIQAPVFGVVWMHSKVRAHVDWWTVKPGDEYPMIRSAPYPGPGNTARRGTIQFHDWSLDRPQDILQVYLFMRNLDRWTVGRFNDLVHEGIAQLAIDVRNGDKFTPWKRKGDMACLVSTNERDSDATFSAVTPASSPPKRKSARRANR